LTPLLNKLLPLLNNKPISLPNKLLPNNKVAVAVVVELAVLPIS